MSAAMGGGSVQWWACLCSGGGSVYAVVVVSVQCRWVGSWERQRGAGHVLDRKRQQCCMRCQYGTLGVQAGRLGVQDGMVGVQDGAAETDGHQPPVGLLCARHGHWLPRPPPPPPIASHRRRIHSRRRAVSSPPPPCSLPVQPSRSCPPEPARGLPPTDCCFSLVLFAGAPQAPVPPCVLSLDAQAILSICQRDGRACAVTSVPLRCPAHARRPPPHPQPPSVARIPRPTSCAGAAGPAHVDRRSAVNDIAWMHRDGATVTHAECPAPRERRRFRPGTSRTETRPRRRQLLSPSRPLRAPGRRR